MKVVFTILIVLCCCCCFFFFFWCFFFQAEDGIRDLVRSRGLGDVYKRQTYTYGNGTTDGFMVAVDNGYQGRVEIVYAGSNGGGGVLRRDGHWGGTPGGDAAPPAIITVDDRLDAGPAVARHGVHMRQEGDDRRRGLARVRRERAQHHHRPDQRARTLHAAADAVGATKMDRPEWGAVNPLNGEVYMTLTNN